MKQPNVPCHADLDGTWLTSQTCELGEDKTPFPESRKVDTLSCGDAEDGVAWKHQGFLAPLPAAPLSLQSPPLPAGHDEGQVLTARPVRSPGPLRALSISCAPLQRTSVPNSQHLCSFPKAYPWTAGACSACAHRELAGSLWDLPLS